jgi:hypothetical protein
MLAVEEEEPIREDDEYLDDFSDLLDRNPAFGKRFSLNQPSLKVYSNRPSIGLAHNEKLLMLGSRNCREQFLA